MVLTVNWHMKRGVLRKFPAPCDFPSEFLKGSCLWWCFPVILECCPNTCFVLFLCSMLERKLVDALSC